MTHYLCYQHNVQQFFIRHIEKFSGIIVPLSIAASFPSGTYGFLRALLAKDRSKQFALDPRSALFQHNWNRASAREPHKKMAAIFGKPFTTQGLDRQLTAKDFESVDSTKLITERCIRYQLDFRVLKEEQRKLEKYRKLLGMDAIPEIDNPQQLVPPYFQFVTIGDPWYEISLRCVENAVEIAPPGELCPIIHFTSWNKIGDWKAMGDRVGELGIASVFVYPNNFKEHQASELELEEYSACIAGLSGDKLKLFALHGGYFAILLQKKGLAGFSNGVGYGEWRDSGYHKGGTAEIRIYIPKLHRFLDAASAQALLSADASYFASDSDLLSEYALAKNPLTQVQVQEALDHFMASRQQELDFVQNNSMKTILAELDETVSVLRKVGPLELEKYGDSLQRWSNILSR